MADFAPRTPVCLIAGPTASGKSALALEIAEAVGGEIIGADSMQLYTDLRVLSARPTPKDEARVAHHLVGIADAGEAWSVGRWLAAALEALADIEARRRTAIVVGGTGLYFRALTRGLASIPPVPIEVRGSVQADYDSGGEAAFRERLARVDAAAESRVAPGDRQRLTRALEVLEATGRPLSAWQRMTTAPLAQDAWRGVVLTLPRAELYRRIDTRFEAMIAAGALGEVAALAARRLDPGLPAMKALGVGSLSRHLAGELSLDEAVVQAKSESRRYAKRQIAWFNHQAPDWPRTEAGAGAPAVLAALAGD
jgi:tRNA dimethylallyltransferase